MLLSRKKLEKTSDLETLLTPLNKAMMGYGNRYVCFTYHKI